MPLKVVPKLSQRIHFGRRRSIARTVEEIKKSDLNSLKMHLSRLSHTWGAKSVAMTVAEQFRTMGHPKELRRHL